MTDGEHDRDRPRWISRKSAKLVVAILAGAFVACTAAYAAWDYGDDSVFGGLQTLTVSQLHNISQAIKEYRHKSGKLPARLDDLVPPATAPDAYWVGHHGLADGWNRPLLYEHDEKNFRLSSLGRDGRPGGAGIDCDLVYDSDRPGGVYGGRKLTFRQFLFEMPTQGIVASCLVSGLLTALQTLWYLRKPDPRSSIVKIVLTMVVCIVLAGIMAVHHLNFGPLGPGH